MEANGHYHCSIDNISRSSGGKVVRFASYITREDSYDIANQQTYRHKKLNDDFISCGLTVPKLTPNIFGTSKQTEQEKIIKFANNLELGIKSKNANLANSMDISLPNCLSKESCERVGRAISSHLADKYGSVNAWALHNDIKTDIELENIKAISPNAQKDNKNMHFLFATSHYLPNTEYGFKYGNTIDDITQKGRRQFVIDLREKVAEEINKELARTNQLTAETKVSAKSYKDQFESGESETLKEKKSMRINKLDFDLKKKGQTTQQASQLEKFIKTNNDVKEIKKELAEVSKNKPIVIEKPKLTPKPLTPKLVKPEEPKKSKPFEEIKNTSSRELQSKLNQIQNNINAIIDPQNLKRLGATPKPGIDSKTKEPYLIKTDKEKAFNQSTMQNKDIALDNLYRKDLNRFKSGFTEIKTKTNTFKRKNQTLLNNTKKHIDLGETKEDFIKVVDNIPKYIKDLSEEAKQLTKEIKTEEERPLTKFKKMVWGAVGKTYKDPISEKLKMQKIERIDAITFLKEIDKTNKTNFDNLQKQSLQDIEERTQNLEKNKDTFELEADKLLELRKEKLTIQKELDKREEQYNDIKNPNTEFKDKVLIFADLALNIHPKEAETLAKYIAEDAIKDIDFTKYHNMKLFDDDSFQHTKQFEEPKTDKEYKSNEIVDIHNLNMKLFVNEINNFHKEEHKPSKQLEKNFKEENSRDANAQKMANLIAKMIQEALISWLKLGEELREIDNKGALQMKISTEVMNNANKTKDLNSMGSGSSSKPKLTAPKPTWANTSTKSKEKDKDTKK